MGDKDHEIGNATVNAMLRSEQVRVAVDTGASYAPPTVKLSPAEARRAAAQIEQLPNGFLRFTDPDGVARVMKREAGRVEGDE
jgi:predicted aspartyl protease